MGRSRCRRGIHRIWEAQTPNLELPSLVLLLPQRLAQPTRCVLRWRKSEAFSAAESEPVRILDPPEPPRRGPRTARAGQAAAPGHSAAVGQNQALARCPRAGPCPTWAQTPVPPSGQSLQRGERFASAGVAIVRESDRGLRASACAKDPGPQTQLGECVTRSRDKGQEQHLQGDPGRVRTSGQ